MSLANLCLGSASPRRRQLLLNVGLSIEVRPADIDETQHDNEAPLDYVTRLAKEKAFAVAKTFAGGEKGLPILTADTVVVCDDKVFGKPSNYDEARQMWRTMSNNKHQVVTAVGLLAAADSTDCMVEIAVSQVVFESISEQAMKMYWNTGEPQDKAGGYAIQGLASAWVKSIEGSYSGVVGLPLFETNRLLSKVDLNWL